MRVLVTGGCGFIGTNLVIRCFNEGWKTDVVDNSYEHVQRATECLPSVRILNTDFASEEVLDAIHHEHYDVIFHQAAVPRVSYSVEEPAYTTDENLFKTVRLLEAAAGHCRRFVFASSSSVYGDTERLPIVEDDFIGSVTKSPYALQKKSSEEFIRLFCDLYEMDAVCLRYFNVFGPHQYGDSPYSTALSSWCHRIKEGTPLRKDGDGEQSRDLCYVDNVVEANILAAKASRTFKGEGINIACGDRTSNNEILDAFAKKFKFEIDQQPFRVGDIMHTQADISYAKEMLGYEPVVRFWDGFEKTLDWWGLND